MPTGYEVQMPGAIRRQGNKADALIKGSSLSEDTVIVSDTDMVSDNPVPVDFNPDMIESVETVNDGVATNQNVDEVATIRQQYSVLQGKYNAEVPRLTQENNDMRSQISTLIANQNALQTIVDTLSRTSDQPEKQDTATIALAINDVDPANFEGYGPEMSELATMANALKHELTEAKKELAFLRQEQGKTSKEVETQGQSQFISKKDNYFRDLDTAIPAWETINMDPIFLNWLAGQDGYTGRTKSNAIVAASEALNAPIVIRIFKDFLAETGYKIPAAASTPQYDINSLIVPNNQGNVVNDGNLNVNNNQRTVTAAQVDEAAKRFARGEIDEAAFNKISNAFQSQLSSGRR